LGIQPSLLQRWKRRITGGARVAATLVAELGTPDDYESPRQILKLAGMSPSGKESGTSVRSGVRQSKRGRPMLRKQLGVDNQAGVMALPRLILGYPEPPSVKFAICNLQFSIS